MSLSLLLLGCTATVNGASEVHHGATPQKGDMVDDPDASMLSTEASEETSCASVEIDVEIEFLRRPADIVWVVDSSGSMGNEAELVQKHMNSFAARFSDASVDAQIVLITPAGFVSVPPPLGADEQRFFQVERSVSSSAALRALLDSWHQYEPRLRDNSIVHFIAVTDDESELRGDCFVEQMGNLVGPDRRFKLHTISSEAIEDAEKQAINDEYEANNPALACAENDSRSRTGVSFQACNGAARPGLEYRKAAQATDGLAISICTPDWSLVFDQLAGTVEQVSVTGCDFAIPEPPPGTSLIAEEVELLADTQAERRSLVRVSSEAACASGDWFYDNPDEPTAVQLCPSTCDHLGSEGAKLSLELGCAWQIR